MIVELGELKGLIMFDFLAENICDVITTPRKQAQKIMNGIRCQIKELGTCPCDLCHSGISDCDECGKDCKIVNACNHCDCNHYNSGCWLEDNIPKIKELAKDFYIVYLQRKIFELQEQLEEKV